VVAEEDGIVKSTLTPIFPPNSKCFATRLEPGPSDLVASKAEQFVRMASSRFSGRHGTFFCVDREHVSLPRSVPRKNVEHVRGLGHDIWASSAPRIGMAE
jgi:hypothetical protein